MYGTKKNRQPSKQAAEAAPKEVSPELEPAPEPEPMEEEAAAPVSQCSGGTRMAFTNVAGLKCCPELELCKYGRARVCGHADRHRLANFSPKADDASATSCCNRRKKQEWQVC